MTTPPAPPAPMSNTPLIPNLYTVGIDGVYRRLSDEELGSIAREWVEWLDGKSLATARTEKAGLEKRIAALDRDATVRTRTVRRLEKALVARLTNVAGECRTCEGVMRSVPYCSKCGAHPWYGPCDGFGDDGECSECVRVSSMKPEG